MSHITGGGLANNLARVIPESAEVRIDRTSWQPAPIFGLLQQFGGISQSDLEATLNIGVGMVVVLPEPSVDAAIRLLDGRGLRAWVCGSVAPAGSGTRERVSLFGQHPASASKAADRSEWVSGFCRLGSHWVALRPRQ